MKKKLWPKLGWLAQMSLFIGIIGTLSVGLSALGGGVLAVSAATTGSSYVPLAPYRLLDTRDGGSPLGANSTQNLTVTGIDTVPSNATAVAVNTTVTQSSNASFLTLYPTGESTPTTSNLNFTAGQTVANLAIVPVGDNGQITIYNALGTVQVILDLQGYFVPNTGSSTTGSYVPLTPSRITDTRLGSNEPNSGHSLTPGGTLNVQATGVGGVPASGVAAVAINITITDTSTNSYITAYPAGISPPAASNVNWLAGETLANRAIVQVGTSGAISFYNALGRADLIVDVVGYFTNGTTSPAGQSLYYPINPTRTLDTRLDGGKLAARSFLPEQFAGVDGISLDATAIVANLTETDSNAYSDMAVVPNATPPTTSDLNFSAGQTVGNLLIPSLNSSGGDYIYNSVGSVDAIIDVFGYFVPESSPIAALSACTAVSLTTSTNPEIHGPPLQVTATSTCPSTANYEYWYQPGSNSSWVLAQSWTTSSTYTYNTTTWGSGTYQTMVWASTQDFYQSVLAIGTQGAQTGSVYTPLAPDRILDTRTTGRELGNNTTQNLTVSGVDGVPSDATAVVLNVTVTQPTNNSILIVYPAGESVPGVSSLNFSAGQTVANLTVVPVGNNGQVSIYNAVGSVQVIADLQGYFVASSGSNPTGSYVPLAPARITDTRANSNEPNSGAPLGAGATLKVQATGAGDIPATGVAAVALNVTVTNTTTYGSMTVYPTGIATPLASNLNWATGNTLANKVIVPVGTNGQITFFNSAGTADLIVDVVGYFTNGSTNPAGASLYYPISPVRAIDTRSDGGTLNAKSYLSEQFAGVDGISPTANAIVANLTSTNASASSFFAITPNTTASTSDLNFAAGQTVPNLIIGTLNSQGSTNIYNSDGTADAIVDVFGYFQPETAGVPALAPCTAASLNTAGTTSTQGTPVAVTADSTCPSTASYEYFYQPSYSSVWVLAQSWTSNSSYSYATNSWAPGTYQLAVWASTNNAYQSVLATTSLMSDATVEVSNITYSAQIYAMTCEEAALEMALSHEGINVTQTQILDAEGVNASVPGVGPAYTKADPMVNFVGQPNGNEGGNEKAGWEPGAYYGAIVRAAQGLGGDVIAAGEGISPQQVYDYVDQGHPVEVWVTFDFHVDYGAEWLGNGIHTWPWAGPDGHVVTIVGINNNSVEIDNPWPVGTYGSEYYGPDEWVPMSTFQAVYGLYDDMAVVLN